MSTKNIEKTLSLIEAYSNPIRSNILLWLKIHKRLSLGNLSRYLSKSKPTVTRHIEKLIELNLVKKFTDEEEIQPGNIKRLYYELNKEVKHSVTGNHLKEIAKTNPEIFADSLQKVLDSRISHYQTLERIAKLTISYLENMKDVVKDNMTNDKKIYEILSDHTGHISFNYLDRDTIFKIVEEDTNDFDSVIKKIGKKDSEFNPYVYIKLLLPLMRVMDMEKVGEWKIDGTLWPARPLQ